MNVLLFYLPRRVSICLRSCESNVKPTWCFIFCSLLISCIFGIQKSFISFILQVTLVSYVLWSVNA